MQELAPTSPRVGPVLQYLRDWPTPPRGRIHIPSILPKLPPQQSTSLMRSVPHVTLSFLPTLSSTRTLCIRHRPSHLPTSSLASTVTSNQTHAHHILSDGVIPTSQYFSSPSSFVRYRSLPFSHIIGSATYLLWNKC